MAKRNTSAAKTQTKIRTATVEVPEATACALVRWLNTLALWNEWLKRHDPKDDDGEAADYNDDRVRKYFKKMNREFLRVFNFCLEEDFEKARLGVQLPDQQQWRPDGRQHRAYLGQYAELVRQSGVKQVS